MEFKLPKPIDAEENQLFVATRVTIQRLKDTDNLDIPTDGIDYIWNQYFWAIFEHRFKKYNQCKTIVKHMFNFNKMKDMSKTFNLGVDK